MRCQKNKNGLSFNDKNTYSIINKNPLEKLQNSTANILKDLSEIIGKLTFKKITLTYTNIPKVYALPKIHKQDTPLRPIISTVNSPTHFSAKILYDELKICIKKPRSHINNSLELKNQLQNIFIPDNYVLLSLDVNSLFTNVSCKLVLNSIDNRFSQINNLCKIPFDKVSQLTQFLFDNTFIQFNNTYY